MSFDPNVDDLGESTSLAALPSIYAPSPDVTVRDLHRTVMVPFAPDPAAVNGEIFILALAYENKNPITAAATDRLFFPVNPEEFSWAQARSVGTYDILNAPQAIQLGNMQARTFSFSSFFPAVFEPDYCIPYPAARLDKTPQASQLWLALAQKAGYPLMFTAVPLRGTGIFGTVKVVISNFNTSYRAGNPLDVYFDLELTEYIEPTIIRYKVQQPKWASTGRFAHHKYVTRKGDTLVTIARAAYGKDYGNHWSQIKSANKTVTYGHSHKKYPLRDSKKRKNPKSNSKLLPNQHLVIPKPKDDPR